MKIREISVLENFLVRYNGKGRGDIYIAPTKEERERQRGERDQIKFIGLLMLDLKDGKLQDSGKQEEGKTFLKLHVLGMNEDLWDRVRGLGSETWKGCE